MIALPPAKRIASIVLLAMGLAGLVPVAQVSPVQASAVDQYAAGWGWNDYGQLGDGTNVSRFAPVPVITTGALEGETVVQVAAGGTHQCALTASGVVACWGWNPRGQLGNGTNTNSYVPVLVTRPQALEAQTFTSVDVGSSHSCATTSGGDIYCWGSNESGQLGVQSTAESWVPVKVNTSENVVSMSTGAGFTCALGSGGQLFCWGSNSFGQLGRGYVGGQDVNLASVDTSGGLAGKVITSVDADCCSACVTTSAGDAFCWGDNYYGQSGIASQTWYEPTPRRVLLDGVSSISVGRGHTCATTTAQKAFCWGWNDYGQLGLGHTYSAAVPLAVDVTGPLSGKAVRQISAGRQHTCALTTDGVVSCWGSNWFGALGSAAAQSYVPIPVTPVPGSFGVSRPVVSIDASDYGTAAIYGFSVRPGSPTGLTVTGDVGSRYLQWQAPVFAGGSPVTQYWVFYRPAGQTTWKAFARGVSATQVPLSANAIQPGPCTGPVVCPRLHGSLQVGTTYDFQVLAVNSYGNGRWSNMATLAWDG